MLRHFFIAFAALIAIEHAIATDLSSGKQPSQELTLVQDGKPACTIVIAESAGPHEKTGANDLQLYLRKMSGATIPITTDPAVPGDRILIGVFGSAPVAQWNGERPVRDAFAITTTARPDGGTDLLLIGGDARGTEYAVYELLERFLGVRWYMPGELGEEVPVQKTITLKPINWVNRPDYEAIRGLTWKGGPGAKDWLRHNKGEVGSDTFFFGHSWSGYIKPSEENKKAHPEWFALQKDGTRGDQLCTTNPEVIDIFIKRVKEHFDKNPNDVVCSISPNDGYGFCTCPRCKALDAQYGVKNNCQTDRFVHFANIILKELKKTHPDKLVGILAYVTHTAPPVSAVPDSNYATLICHTPWGFCHVHTIDDPNCPSNTKFREMINGWTKVCKHVGVYDYYGHFYVMTPWPIVHNIRKDVPYLHSIGVKAFESETQQHWANQGINFYMAAKLLWDTDADSQALLDDFYHRFYGPAEQPMRQYWEKWESAMTHATCQDSKWLTMFTPELMQTTGQLLSEAEKLAGDNDEVRRRLALNRTGYRFTDAYASMRRHGEAGELEPAVAAGEKALEIVNSTKGTEPQAFWIQLAYNQTRAQLKPYKKKLYEMNPGKPSSQPSPKDDAKAILNGEEK